MKVFYFDKQEAWQSVLQFAAKLAGQFPEIEKIVLFGSLVRDESVPGSDVDLLLVVGDTELAFLDRPARYRIERLPVTLDLFVYTAGEISTMLADNNGFIKRALSEGRILFERSHASTDT